MQIYFDNIQKKKLMFRNFCVFDLWKFKNIHNFFFWGKYQNILSIWWNQAWITSFSWHLYLVYILNSCSNWSKKHVDSPPVHSESTYRGYKMDKHSVILYASYSFKHWLQGRLVLTKYRPTSSPQNKRRNSDDTGGSKLLWSSFAAAALTCCTYFIFWCLGISSYPTHNASMIWRYSSNNRFDLPNTSRCMNLFWLCDCWMRHVKCVLYI